MSRKARFFGLLALLTIVFTLAFGGQAFGQQPPAASNKDSGNPIWALEEKIAALEARVAALESQGAGGATRTVIDWTIDPTADPDEVVEDVRTDTMGTYTNTYFYAKLVIPGALVADLPILQLAMPYNDPSVFPQGCIMANSGYSLHIRDGIDGLEVFVNYRIHTLNEFSWGQVDEYENSFFTPSENGLIHLTLVMVQ